MFLKIKLAFTRTFGEAALMVEKMPQSDRKMIPNEVAACGASSAPVDLASGPSQMSRHLPCSGVRSLGWGGIARGLVL
jgi:hypothetical protein